MRSLRRRTPSFQPGLTIRLTVLCKSVAIADDFLVSPPAAAAHCLARALRALNLVATKENFGKIFKCNPDKKVQYSFTHPVLYMHDQNPKNGVYCIIEVHRDSAAKTFPIRQRRSLSNYPSLITHRQAQIPWSGDTAGFSGGHRRSTSIALPASALFLRHGSRTSLQLWISNLKPLRKHAR